MTLTGLQYSSYSFSFQNLFASSFNVDDKSGAQSESTKISKMSPTSKNCQPHQIHVSLHLFQIVPDSLGNCLLKVSLDREVTVFTRTEATKKHFHLKPALMCFNNSLPICSWSQIKFIFSYRWKRFFRVVSSGPKI